MSGSEVSAFLRTRDVFFKTVFSPRLIAHPCARRMHDILSTKNAAKQKTAKDGGFLRLRCRTSPPGSKA
jgi:hypothetical protein